jgi:8-oxo-dGTP pyrophosphatase MutT (NUDIX family)
MAQKYKFFIKEKSVTFSQDAVFKENDKTLTTAWIGWLQRLDIPDSSTVKLNDLEGFIDELRSSIPFIVAGGGVVFNAEGELLMIHRRGYWDLPKGKVEEEEGIEQAAVREVEEECGVLAPQIVSEPFATYHLYHENGQTLVKHSVWFRMRLPGKPDLTPQSEEDIAEALWMTLPLNEDVLHGAYPSIREVLDQFI